MNTQCECRDPACPVCHGECGRTARVVLVRVDMEDEEGCPMCRGCAADAMSYGVFEDKKERDAERKEANEGS